MPTGNNITLVGNLTRDPELRFTPSGQPTVTFGLAVNRRWQDGQQQWQEATSFFDIVAWGQLAENVAESVQRGATVVVTGRLDQRSWETNQGDKRSKIEVTADEVAPSLRWAIVEISKNTRQGAGERVSVTAGGPGPEQDEDEPF